MLSLFVGTSNSQGAARPIAKAACAAAVCVAGLLAASSAAQPAATPPPLATTTPLHSVTKAGLFELGPDYKSLRRLSKSPATYARYLPGQQQILLYWDSGQVDEKPVLRLFDLTTQKERLVAKLPNDAAPTIFYAEPDAERVRLSLQQGIDFCTDGKSAAFILMDRNINMMDETALLTVDLATGKQKLTPLFCSSSRAPSAACKRAMAKQLNFRCPYSFVSEAPAPGKEDGFAHRMNDGILQRREPGGPWRRLGKLADFESEARSPSGRYQLLSGRREEGDYIYRGLIALDAQTGELLCLGDPRVKRLPTKRIADCTSVTAVGEADIHWLANPDRLLIDSTLFDLEKSRAVTIGSLVR